MPYILRAVKRCARMRVHTTGTAQHTGSKAGAGCLKGAEWDITDLTKSVIVSWTSRFDFPKNSAVPIKLRYHCRDGSAHRPVGEHADVSGRRGASLGLSQLGAGAAGQRVPSHIESAEVTTPRELTHRLTEILRAKLGRYGLADNLLVFNGQNLSALDAADDPDLLLDMAYHASAQVLRRFRRTALLDIDPGLLQVWLSEGQAELAPHDIYFTIGETVGRPDAKFPGGGVDWIYVPPCVALDTWTAYSPNRNGAFTTVTHWSTSAEWVIHGAESYHNDKRTGFEPFLELPRFTVQPVMLALCQAADESFRLTPDEAEEKQRLQRLGWQVVHAHAVASTPWDYQKFIRDSKGEFSCAKPSCVKLENAWVSDRSLCYLATGRPVVVQHTGPSRFLPERSGMFRFQNLAEAARCLETVAADYARQCRLARALAEEFFDARKVAARVLDRAL
jgi:hypothetical protein